MPALFENILHREIWLLILIESGSFRKRVRKLTRMPAENESRSDRTIKIPAISSDVPVKLAPAIDLTEDDVTGDGAPSSKRAKPGVPSSAMTAGTRQSLNAVTSSKLFASWTCLHCATVRISVVASTAERWEREGCSSKCLPGRCMPSSRSRCILLDPTPEKDKESEAAAAAAAVTKAQGSRQDGGSKEDLRECRAVAMASLYDREPPIKRRRTTSEEKEAGERSFII